MERKDYFYITSIAFLFLIVVTGYSSNLSSDVKSLTVDPVANTLDQTQTCELETSLNIDDETVIANVTHFSSPEEVAIDSHKVRLKAEEIQDRHHRTGIEYTCEEVFEGEGEYSCEIQGEPQPETELGFVIEPETNYNPFQDRCEFEGHHRDEDIEWIRTESYASANPQTSLEVTDVNIDIEDVSWGETVTEAVEHLEITNTGNTEVEISATFPDEEQPEKHLENDKGSIFLGEPGIQELETEISPDETEEIAVYYQVSPQQESEKDEITPIRETAYILVNPEQPNSIETAQQNYTVSIEIT